MYSIYNQSQQDYLECILTLSKEGLVHRVEVANRMGVSQSAVNKAVRVLSEKGYLYEDGKHLYLTAKGKTYAEGVYEKHCTIRLFLERIGVEPAVAERDACHMEHVVSDETVAKMKEFLEDSIQAKTL